MRRRIGLGDIQSDLELIPGTLLVRQVHAPDNFRVGQGEFLDCLPLRVQTVNAKHCSLALQGAAWVAIETRRKGRRIDELRSGEKIVFAVADARNADRRMNRRPHDDVVLVSGTVTTQWTA